MLYIFKNLLYTDVYCRHFGIYCLLKFPEPSAVSSFFIELQQHEVCNIYLLLFIIIFHIYIQDTRLDTRLLKKKIFKEHFEEDSIEIENI